MEMACLIEIDNNWQDMSGLTITQSKVQHQKDNSHKEYWSGI